MTIAANTTLARAAMRRFGSWHGALRAAGVEPCARRTWTRQRVLEEIQAWDRRGAFAEGGRIEDHGLVCAARRRFGSWQRALAAAGVQLSDPENRRRWKWPRRRILEAIQDRHVRGQPLFACRDRSLSGAAISVFRELACCLAGRGSQA